MTARPEPGPVPAGSLVEPVPLRPDVARVAGDGEPAAAPVGPVGRDVLDTGDIGRALTRMAHEILERNRGSADLVLLGIPTRGVPLAARLARLLERFDTARPAGAPRVAHGSLDIGLYRDDFRLRPARPLARTDLGTRDVDGATVVIVDDVLFSGRSVRAALSALDEFGRPRAVQLAVLVDRGHRELPIRADYVGKNLPTARTEQVRVRLAETDGADSVTISGATGTASGAGTPAPTAPAPTAPAPTAPSRTAAPRTAAAGGSR